MKYKESCCTTLIASKGKDHKFSVLSAVSTEHVLLLHHKVEKIENEIVVSWICMFFPLYLQCSSSRYLHASLSHFLQDFTGLLACEKALLGYSI